LKALIFVRGILLLELVYSLLLLLIGTFSLRKAFILLLITNSLKVIQLKK